MAYSKTKSSYSYGSRRRKAAPRSRYGSRTFKSRASPRWARNRLDKLVASKTQQALKKLRRGPPRCLPVQLTAAQFDRTKSIPDVRALGQWTAYGQGPSSAEKYVIIPVSELLPPQRPSAADPDDRFRTYDSVYVKGVSLRMTINYAEGVRLMAFAFRNGRRRDTSVSTATRPFADAASTAAVPAKGQQPVSQLLLEVMSKEQLMGIPSGKEHVFRNMGVQDGPFKLSTGVDGILDWHSVDSTAFTSRLSSDQGGPIGKVFAKVDGEREKSCGRVFKALYQSGGIMRTTAFDSKTSNLQGFVSTRTRQVELFFALNKRIRFAQPGGSTPVDERPIELFVFFDAPGPLQGAVEGPDIPSGAIMGMNLDVYYE